jgi:hypothetical protein
MSRKMNMICLITHFFTYIGSQIIALQEPK